MILFFSIVSGGLGGEGRGSIVKFWVDQSDVESSQSGPVGTPGSARQVTMQVKDS